MAYVDLNPIRAGMVETPEDSDFTSIQARLRQFAQSHQSEPATPADPATEQPADLLPFIGGEHTDSGKEIAKTANQRVETALLSPTAGFISSYSSGIFSLRPVVLLPGQWRELVLDENQIRLRFPRLSYSNSLIFMNIKYGCPTIVFFSH